MLVEPIKMKSGEPGVFVVATGAKTLAQVDELIAQLQDAKESHLLDVPLDSALRGCC